MSLRMRWPVVVAACVSSAVFAAHAEVVPVAGLLDARIRSAVYDPAQVYRLQGFVGYSIELEFEEGEEFAGQGGGDLDAIGIGAYRNHVILKPRAQQVLTNLVIYTNRRAYRFDYAVDDRVPDPAVDPLIYAIRFTYPMVEQEKQQAAREREAVEQRFVAARALRSQNVNYWFCGSRAVKPSSAFDDGVHTYLTFGRRAELPAVFVLNEDGSESLLNFNLEQGQMVIHRVARRFIVRRGRLTGCIVNRSFDGGGERLESGTVASGVLKEGP